MLSYSATSFTSGLLFQRTALAIPYVRIRAPTVPIVVLIIMPRVFGSIFIFSILFTINRKYYF
ncbi:hypothetical protein KEN51_CDS0058 [Pseudomonas phage vB_Pae10145-KEN51]|nr:hypothetical protein [Pseudomonas phage PhiPizzaParty]